MCCITALICKEFELSFYLCDGLKKKKKKKLGGHHKEVFKAIPKAVWKKEWLINLLLFGINLKTYLSKYK